MFEKLLAALPHNPSLMHQLAFYSRRMRSEESIRRTGLVFIVLAFAVQFFAVVSPPQPTVAASNNDLINGGFSSAAQAANDCRANLENYGTILQNYGISCDRVASASTITIYSTSFNRQLYSMGRLPYGIAGETPVNIAGATYYVRYLWGWDRPGTTSAYQALNVTNPGGQTFLLLYNCGNVTSVGLPVPVPKPAPPAPPAPTPTVSQPTPPATCQYDSSLLASDKNCVPCPTNSSIIASSDQCKSCEQALSSQDTIACVEIHKTAADLTQGTTDANGTTAQPGDVIKYTLYADNTGKDAVTNYVFQEDLSDVLDYAAVSDLGGGTMNAQNVVVWPALTIAAGQTVTKTLTVKVDDPVPQTPTSSSDPEHFNLVMTNVYGNTININVPASPTKTIETTAANLPNTGPGSSLVVGAVILALTAFFFARARLLRREAELALDHNVNGEM